MTTPYAAWLMAYFLDERLEDGEQIRFALSETAEPTSWRPLDGGDPILHSTVGEGGVRDPFLLRDRSSGRFHLIATDLRVHPDEDWARRVRRGSRGIVVWDSGDLVHWGSPRLVPIAPENAGNAWAPKAFWSEPDGCWFVFYAAALYGDGPRDAGEYQRILVAPTTDFTAFGESRVYIDEQHDVIDATFIHDGDTWYRFSANALGEGDGDAPRGFILEERGTSLLGEDYERFTYAIGHGEIRRGEGPAVATSFTQKKWYLFIDEFGFSGYNVFSTTDLTSGRWERDVTASVPEGARHGSMLPITAAERDRLADAFG